MKKLLLTFFVSGLLLNLSAQEKFKCLTDYYDSIEVAKNPAILVERQALENFTKEYIKNKPKDENTLIIPMVFHVLHRYGEERLTMEQIEYGIAQLNKDYQAQNSELNSIVSTFIPIIGTANIEFRLAKLDPDGNCTTGVVYYDTELTYFASNDMKYTIENWDPTSYLNVWSVSSIESGAAAWSQYPGVSSAVDGVVSIYRYISSGHTIGHEVGHYLNLAHPWGSTNEPGLESNCNLDDNVDDTPNTIGVDQHCNLGQVSCGSLDNVQNFMDYSTCDAMFTVGQTDRMRAALNSTTGGRKYLWSSDNLTETGTSDNYVNPGCAPVADFTNNVYDICPGTSFQFNDFSYAGESTDRVWTFEGGEPETSTLADPLITYNTPGLFSVSLNAMNSMGENTLEREKLIFVVDTLGGYKAPVLIDMQEEAFPDFTSDIFKQWQFINNGNGNWEKYSDENENTALRINNYTNDYEIINSVITPNINLSETENPEYIYFDIAYAQRNMDSQEELKVFVSPDCGKKWIVKYIKSGKSLVTSNNEYVTGEFIPADSEWKTERVSIGNYANNNHLRIKFQMESNKGNYFYLDNIKIGEVESSVHSSLARVLSIYPNPAKSELNINFSLNKDQEVAISVRNILGSLVSQQSMNGLSGNNTVKIALNQQDFKPGIYMVNLVSGEYQSSKQFVISQ
jgi:hypothetical protein